LGTVFRLNKDGSDYSILHTFGDGIGDGAIPVSGVVEGTDGTLYGTTSAGGNSGYGTAFKLNKDGSEYQVLHNFTGTDSAPEAALVEGNDGALYGTTFVGSGDGTVFRLSKDGTSYSVLHQFSAATATNGLFPKGSLLQGGDGALYGTTSEGGMTSPDDSSGSGTVFKLNVDGSAFTVLHRFGAFDGAHPYAGLVCDSDGVLYGTTFNGGNPQNRPNYYGTVFSLNQDGSGLALLYTFPSASADGESPTAPVVVGSDRKLYGTTSLGGTNNGGTVFTLQKDGGGYRTLVWFRGGGGSAPSIPPIETTDGALYGAAGGANGSGVIYTLNKDGIGYHLVFGFDGQITQEFDGLEPTRLVEGSDRVLYGVTRGGGANDWGMVFRLETDGSGFRILHSFYCTIDDGLNPSGLFEGSDAALYGVTDGGGGANGYAGGVIFKLNKDGSGYGILRSFDNAATGEGANTTLMEGSDGGLYGTRWGSGLTNSTGLTLGIVFKMNKDGSGYTILHSFSGFNHGDTAHPSAPLTEGSDGSLYGVTYGDFFHFGAVFRLDKDGGNYAVLTTLYKGGWTATGPVKEARDGALYGTTFDLWDFSMNNGTLFTLNKDGSGYDVLYRFAIPRDGLVPRGGLTTGSDGALYGTTSRGGFSGDGTVFKLYPPETPDFVSVTNASDAVQVTFAGASGFRYQLLRSGDLANWTVVTNITMPSGGIYTYPDRTFPNSAAFYRAAWTQ
jgi:uncharacterized repeat protein (TIGR03803 family)